MVKIYGKILRADMPNSSSNLSVPGRTGLVNSETPTLSGCLHQVEASSSELGR
jgi:hypothetical protein